jgi:two-component system capsular synthesis sensor histidine kinase RcsC
VLVVDDNEISLEIMKNQLASVGAEVDTAASGRHALWKAQTERYDLILTDIEMPGMNGFGLVKAIRRLELCSRRRTPILAITAADFRLTAEGASAAGFDGHMLKPLDVQILKARLQILGRRSSAY